MFVLEDACLNQKRRQLVCPQGLVINYFQQTEMWEIINLKCRINSKRKMFTDNFFLSGKISEL